MDRLFRSRRVILVIAKVRPNRALFFSSKLDLTDFEFVNLAEKFKNAEYYIEDDTSSTTYTNTNTNSSDASPISSVTNFSFSNAAQSAIFSATTAANSLQSNYFFNAQASGAAGPGVLLTANRALINPFDTSHVTVKVTSNRRRWTHVFPKGEHKIKVTNS